MYEILEFSRQSIEVETGEIIVITFLLLPLGWRDLHTYVKCGNVEVKCGNPILFFIGLMETSKIIIFVFFK